MTLLNEINAYNDELDLIHMKNKPIQDFTIVKDRIYEIINESSDREVELISRKDKQEMKRILRNNNYI